MLADWGPAAFQKPHAHGCCWSPGDTHLGVILVHGQDTLKHLKASMGTFWRNINNLSGTASQCQLSLGALNILLFANTAFLSHSCHPHWLFSFPYLCLPAVQFSGSELAHFSSLTAYVQLPVAFPKLLFPAVPFANEQVSTWHLQQKEEEERKEDRNRKQMK